MTAEEKIKSHIDENGIKVAFNLLSLQWYYRITYNPSINSTPGANQLHYAGEAS